MAARRNQVSVSAFGETDTSGSLDCPTGRSASQLIRHLIANATKDESTISDLYRELIRSLKVKFGSFHYLGADDKMVEVRCINAHPERSAARMIRDDNLTLPIVAVGIPTNESDKKREKFKPIYRAETYWDKNNQRARRVISLVPKPVTIEWPVYVWAYYQANMDQITSQIQSLFKPDLELTTKYSEVTKVYLDREVDQSVVETADREDRVLRRKFNLSIQTYIPTPKFLFTSTGQIEQFNAETLLKKDSRNTPL